MFIIPENIPTVVNTQRCNFDFSQTNRITASGNDVVSIADLFNTGVTLSQSVSTNRPKTGTRTLNGLNVIDFDGVNQFLNFSSNKAVSEPFTIFVVAQVDSTSNQTIIGRQTSSISGQWTLVKNGGFPIFQTYAFGASGPSSGTTKVYNSNPNIHCIKLAEGSALEYSLNNDTPNIAPVVLTGYDNNVATPLVVGSSVGTSNFLNGCVGQVIIYGSVLTTDQKSAINRDLSKKWGIAIS